LQAMRTRCNKNCAEAFYLPSFMFAEYYVKFSIDAVRYYATSHENACCFQKCYAGSLDVSVWKHCALSQRTSRLQSCFDSGRTVFSWILCTTASLSVKRLAYPFGTKKSH